MTNDKYLSLLVRKMVDAIPESSKRNMDAHKKYEEETKDLADCFADMGTHPQVNAKDDYILQEMERYNADGVDFVPLCFSPNEPFSTVYRSFTKEQWLRGEGVFLKTNRKYWRIDDKGNRQYIE